MKYWFCAVLIILLSSCQWFRHEKKASAIARVGKNYLYKSDVASIVPAGTPKKDSILIIRGFIDNWATQKLLIDAAERNLNDVKKNQFNALIKQYKNDLYTKAYLDEIVKQSVDTVITEEELKKYYSENKENFRTNGLLVRLRYVNVDKSNPNFSTIKSKFFDYNKKDKKFWDTYSMQFKSYALNDSIWVDMGQIYGKLPFINPDNRDEIIVVGKRIEKEDGNDVYLVKVANVIDKNQISPFEFIKPTLKEVIINKRKLELIKKFQKEYIDDAIKNNDYEIYK